MIGMARLMTKAQLKESVREREARLRDAVAELNEVRNELLLRELRKKLYG